MINVVSFSLKPLSEVANTKGTMKRGRVARIVAADYSLAVGEVSESARELPALWRVIIQELRRTFILADANMPIIRSDGNNPVIPDLVNVLGGQKNSGIYFSLCFRIVDLVARITKGR